ncbi:AAA family ATPase [Deinococcus sp. HMF7620]|uniref:AAA family ATPase n=1 Tax=Deinococcus arboris TaxID=2682977 RepID=A0A7C9HQL8_9DEIO|nr:BTAD domain-containing putative transcriptional regulator [Deinococcus arboris]MVN86269.1 AAA family ATPase [Deinococcus arboris]
MTAEPLCLHTLGVPQVTLAGQVLDVTGKSLALLVYLAIEGQTPREVLADLLWTDQDAGAARRNLRVQVHRLRASPAGAWLAVSGGALGLRPGVQVDALTLQEALAGGDLARAAALAGGRFLDHLSVPGAAAFDDWHAVTAQATFEAQLRALDGHAAAQSRAGAWAEAAATHRRALGLDPLRERSARALMDACLALGQPEDALDAYRTLERHLAQELGGTPLPATQALRAQIEALLAGPVTAPSPPAAPLVGRAQDCRALHENRLTMVLGEAGLGKTRLVTEAAGEALLIRGVPELTPLPYGALLDVLRAGAIHHCPPRLRPLLSAALAPPGAVPPPDRAALLDALAQALVSLCGGRTLILDDLHWLDPSTLEAAFLALHRGAPRLWLTARPAELNARPELLEVLARLNPPRLTLNELNEAEVGTLIQALSGASAPLFSRRLYEATAGHPLFLLETLRDLRERGLLTERGGRWHTPFDASTVNYAEVPVPPSVTAAISQRLDRLGEHTRRLLHAGALWGETFSAALVAAACDLGEGAALDALEGAQTSRLIVPEGPVYRFGHHLYRRVLTATLGQPRARFLHGRLARLAPAGTPPAALARHYELAGEVALAWPHWHAAALDAERLYAHADALDLSARALACSPPPNDAFALHAERSDLCRHLDDSATRRAALAAMQAIAADLNDPALHAEHAVRAAKCCTEDDDYAGAIATAQGALTRWGAYLGADNRSALLLESGAALACLDRWPEAEGALGEALALTRGINPVRESNILYWLGYSHLQTSQFDQAAQHYLASVQALPTSSPTRGRVLSLWRYGASLRRLGQWPAASAALTDADVCARTLNAGSIRGLIVAEQAALALDGGDPDTARTLAAEAQTLLPQQGDEGWDVLRPVLAAVGLAQEA